jgi:hypothetical protein
MKRFLVLAALLALSIPAFFAAPSAGKGKPEASSSSSSGQSPAALCKEQLRTMGADNFRSKYAPNGNGKNAFGKCVSTQSQLAQGATKNAAKACKAERLAGVDAFNAKYGTNGNKRNAFGKCVSQKAQEQVEEEQEETLSAAKACKKEKAAGAQTFADKYGTGNKKNAFGKCVAAQSKESGDSND